MTTDELTTEILEPVGPFSFRAAQRFLAGPLPIAPRPGGGGDGAHVHLAFVPDGGARHAVGVCVRADGPRVVVEATTPPGGSSSAAVGAQVARILSLDVDGSGWPAVGELDPVIGRLQRRFEHLRPVNFVSPFEAGAWFLLGQRVRMAQAAAAKRRLADELGERVVVHGEELPAFPAPSRLVDLEPAPGVPPAKAERLRALARAAEEGLLDASHLRALPVDEARAALLELPGVGPFTADGILIRGAGAPDVLTLHEPRVRHAVRAAYELDHLPDDGELTAISESWRPFRSWATVLLRAAWQEESGPPTPLQGASASTRPAKAQMAASSSALS